MIELKGLRLAGIYLMLKNFESDLDPCLRDLSDDIEAYLYDRLSIEEMEELSKLYKECDSDLDSKI